ncbi:phosphoribosyltransferase family protein [Pseudonocardia hispaniensis]|uniref:Phosphoribosyltransferase family protein n=1 Tax=Pseudonocardia hispaniensis TaxID=904933 RepID=A0ABW1IZN4_9PSEU
MPFTDRVDAGERLAKKLRRWRGENVVVLGLPRGGVPVAFQVAQGLQAPLDVIVVRKLGVPFQPELAMGAIGEGEVLVRNERVLRTAHISDAELAEVEQRERAELDRRARRFRGDRPGLGLAGRSVIVVDDGIATGSTAAAACQVVKARGAARVVLAVPVCARESAARLRDEVDELVCLETPARFGAVGQFYERFGQTSDHEVIALLQRSERGVQAPRAAPTDDDDPPLRDDEIEMGVGTVRLPGQLVVPVDSRGIVVFAHGSGSSRHSPRNRYVARVLQGAGLATLLVDLLTEREETSRAVVFDVELLAGRLAEITEWARREPECRDLPACYFGASTGAAAALWAAAAPDAEIAAVVSRGGRPDLAAPRLGDIRVPTLLIVGGRDEIVLDLNRQAQARLRCANRLAVVPGATHLFEQAGALEQVAALARDWFIDHVGAVPHPGGRGS